VVEVIPYGRGVGPTDVLTVAAAAEERLTHPMAQAIVRAARARGIEVPERETSDYAIGLGVEATVTGMSVLVGSHRLMASKGISMRRAQWDLRRIDDAAASPIFVAVDGDLLGILVCSDPLRPEAPGVVRALRERGVKEIVMLTGDHPAVAKTAAETLGITRYIADALPEQKSDFVQSLQQRGSTVAVVGDGINDSPALARADVGIAVHGGTDVARETAHVAVLEGNLWKIPQAIDIAREAMGIVRQNWNLVFYPNTAAIAASLIGLIGPVGATLLSNGAAVLSTLNGLRPLLGGRPGSDERRDELLDGELGRGAEHDRPEPVAGRANGRRRVRLPQVAPTP
jgi:Cu2+-exporting ATPase